MARDDEPPYSQTTAFLLWLGWLFGFGGLHRLYLGKTWTGILWLLTWGLFGIGQVVDVARLRLLVEDENDRQLALTALAERRALRRGQAPRGLPPAARVDTAEIMRKELLLAARQHGGKLSVTQGVMATGKRFDEVERLLDEMAKSGYVGITNDQNGAVVYTFEQLT